MSTRRRTGTRRSTNGPACSPRPSPATSIVCQPHTHAVALMGELSAETLQFRGIRGYVVDGACRDVEFILRLGFQTCFRHHTPKDIVSFWLPDGFDVPIAIGDVRIHGGDYLLADRDGIVIVPARPCRRGRRRRRDRDRHREPDPQGHPRGHRSAGRPICNTASSDGRSRPPPAGARPADNVASPAATSRPAPSSCSTGCRCGSKQPVPTGHKLARRDIAAGEKVLKYGAPIGSARGADRARLLCPHAQSEERLYPDLGTRRQRDALSARKARLGAKEDGFDARLAEERRPQGHPQHGASSPTSSSARTMPPSRSRGRSRTTTCMSSASPAATATTTPTR